SLDAVGRPLIPRNLAALRVVGVAPFVAGEADHARELRRGTGVDRLLRAGDDFVVVARVVEPLHERRAGHAVHGDGTGQSVLLDARVVLGRAELDRLAAELLGDAAGGLDVPLLAGRVEAPEDD